MSTPKLNERDLEILQALADGKLYCEIAEEFNLSPKYVQNRMSYIRQRIGARTRIQAVVIAVRLELID